VADVRAHSDCALLTLSGAGAANLGVERRFVAPFEVVEPVHEPTRARIGGAHRWRGRLRALIADAGSTETLRTASRADIALLPHQLEPALAVTRGMGARVLIADEVGLGKTIQAGLIVAELRARGAADRVLIVTPAGLRDQWVDELHRRFSLDSALLDAPAVRQRLSQLATGVNPWITYPIVVTSGDYIKRPEVLAAVAGCRWDVLIVDEAHGAPPGTDRHRAHSFLAERTPYVVLLTATPHNGDRDAFRSLCTMGSQPPAIPPQIVPRRLLVFRRTRREVALGPGRRVHRVLVAPTADERRMHLLLAEFSAAVRQDRGDRDRDAWLALAMLHKRAFSSARALELTVRRRMLGLIDAEAAGQLLLPLDEDGETDQADATPAWTGPALNDTNRERVLLGALAVAAARAAGAESKVTRLSRLLTTLARRREQALVFTEYRDTLHHLQGRLPAPAGVLHGGLSRAERRAAVNDFDSGRTPVLLATDAAGEGLNLHRACRVVITLELPWNPIRLEQRIGRVDRIGQERRVHAFHMIARQTGEAAIAARLRSRIAVSQLEMGAADPLDDADSDAEHRAEQDVVGGRWLDSAGRPHQAESPVGPRQAARWTDDLIQVVRLKPEAAAEHARLERARRLLRWEMRPDRLRETGPLISRAGSPAMRALIGSCWLAIVRSAIEDACGRIVAVCLTSLRLKVELPNGVGSLQIARGAGREIEEHVAAAVRRDREAWVSSSVSWHSAFWAARIARECPQPAGDETGRVAQLGLFTRHADRLGSGPQTSGDVAQRSMLEVVRRASELHITTGRVALLILP
jgi:superfamily II DNA or RNA helicase